MAFTDLISSVVSGGITGIIGAAITRYADYKTKQLDKDILKEKNAHEIELKKIDVELLREEWNARMSIAETEGDYRVEEQDARSFNTALTSEPKLFSNPTKYTRLQNTFMVFLDMVRGLIRPGLTLYLCIITTAVYWQAGKIIEDQPIAVSEAVAIYTQISDTILYLCTTCVLFYFGVRSKSERNR